MSKQKLYDSPIGYIDVTADVETRPVLKKLARAHQALAELKGVAASMPNQGILVTTLSLQEAKDSSEIENIVTSHDDLYRSDLQAQKFASIAAKEVHSYADALRTGFERVQDTGLIRLQDILDIHCRIEDNRAGLRKVSGTSLKNDQTGEVVFMPPQHPSDVEFLMEDLVLFINGPDEADLDPLTRMAIIHHQFESIHPFYDGNGRTGRVLNILMLVLSGLLGSPVLYLSRYINHEKADYYRLLQEVRDTGEWEPWLLFMLDGIVETAQHTTELVNAIKIVMLQVKHELRNNLPKIYSQDLINNLFRHPYTKIDFLAQELGVHRNTANKYLNALVEHGVLAKHKLGKENFYINNKLFGLLHGVGAQQGGKD